jgi:glycerol uptake facilitator-like aquaporin
MRGVSGAHLNPAVTMGIMVSQPPLAYEFNLIQGTAYIFCQLFGSIMGAVLCAHLIPLDMVDRDKRADFGGDEAGAAAHTPGSVTFMTRGVLSGDHGVSVFIFELICTFAIVWVFFATMIDHRSRKRTGGFGPVAVGLGIIVGVLAEGPGTGGLAHPCFRLARESQQFWCSQRGLPGSGSFCVKQCVLKDCRVFAGG